MKEAFFVQQNTDRWKKFEALLNGGEKVSPDELSALFIRLTDDLSFARTYFPASATEQYLNYLVMQAHRLIYRNKPVKKGRIKRFWLKEYPLLFRKHRRKVFFAFVVFLVAVALGVLSQVNDPAFARLVMGDRYVNMTLAHIDQGDPLAVYKQMKGIDMFLGISVNNIFVAFITYVYGIFLSIGSAWKIFQTGLMIGTFHAFLTMKGVTLVTQMSIWVHGTFEIFSILVAGGAGFVLGNSFLFPGTLPRKTSLALGARESLKLVTGLIPFFVVAAMLEGFITRYVLMPWWLKGSIILASAGCIVWYFFIFPVNLLKETSKSE